MQSSPSPRPLSPEEVAHSTPEKRQSTTIPLCLNVAHALTQFMLGGVIISGLIIPNKGNMTITSQHIPFCTLGYFILMTQGILVFSPYGWASQLNYKYKITIHYMMEILGSIVVIVSSVLVMANVNKNFSTGHGSCGIVAMLLTMFTLVELLPGLMFPNVKCKKLLGIIHVYVGSAVLCFASMSLIFAFHDYYRGVVGNSNANTAIMLTVFSLIGTLLMVLIKRIKKLFL